MDAHQDATAETITIDVQKLHDNWQPSQKNEVKRSQVEHYKLLMQRGDAIKPIMLERIEFDIETGDMSIRTLDGRHRLKAAFELGHPQIRAVKTDVSIYIKEVFGL